MQFTTLQPLELEIRNIGELTADQFLGIFRLTYNGQARILLKTKVQVSKDYFSSPLRSLPLCQTNPLNKNPPDIHFMAGSKGVLAAKDPLVVPMLLRLSRFKLNSYVVLVVSKQKCFEILFTSDSSNFLSS